MPKIEVNGIQLYYELHGPEDGDVLVLSNGIMMSTASWMFQTVVLAKHMRVLLYDCRGMWQSDRPDEPYSMDLHADDLAALLEALGIAKAHIGGISYGSEVSLSFALRYPEKCQSLIVIDGVSEVSTLLKSQSLPWREAAERNDPRLLFLTSVHLNFSEEWIKRNAAYLDGSIAAFAKIDMPAFIRLMDSFANFNVSERLHEIACPTLIVVGEEDLIKGPKYARFMEERIPNSEYVVVPGAGHALCLEKPAELNSLLLGFTLKHSQRSIEETTSRETGV